MKLGWYKIMKIIKSDIAKAEGLTIAVDYEVKERSLEKTVTIGFVDTDKVYHVLTELTMEQLHNNNKGLQCLKNIFPFDFITD